MKIWEYKVAKTNYYKNKAKLRGIELKERHIRRLHTEMFINAFRKYGDGKYLKSLFKYTYGDVIQKIIPNSVSLFKRIPKDNWKGQKWNVPVRLPK